MLSKLIKYDLKFIYKELAIFYIITLFFAIVAHLTDREAGSPIIDTIHLFAQGACFGFCFGTFINATLRTWTRLRNNFYGDESYLTHTLPIARHTLWTSKFLTSLIVATITVLVSIIAFLIMFFSESFIREWGLSDPVMLKFYLCFILAVICQIIFILQCGYTGIILGFKHNNSHTLHSVIYGLAIYFLGGFGTIILSFLLWSTFDSTIADALFRGVISDANSFLKLLLGIATIYLVLIVATYFINNRLLAHGVNVD